MQNPVFIALYIRIMWTVKECDSKEMSVDVLIKMVEIFGSIKMQLFV